MSSGHSVPHAAQPGSNSARSADISCSAAQNTAGVEDGDTLGEAVAAEQLGSAGGSAGAPAASSQSGPRPAQAGSGIKCAAGACGGNPGAAYEDEHGVDDIVGEPKAEEEAEVLDSSTAQPAIGSARAVGDSGGDTHGAADEDDQYLADDLDDEAEVEVELEGADRDHSAFLTNAEWRARPDNATLQARGEAAAMGAFLADAATVGLHGCAPRPLALQSPEILCQ